MTIKPRGGLLCQLPKGPLGDEKHLRQGWGGLGIEIHLYSCNQVTFISNQ
jgi:hypothetical protein